jgi:hypothetical protein
VFRKVDGVVEMDEALVDLEAKEKEDVVVVYPTQEKLERFWGGLLEAKQVLVEARDRGYVKEDGEFVQEYKDVKDAVELWSWDLEGMRKKVEDLEQVAHIGEIVGYEAVAG